MHDIEMHEPTEEFAHCWRAAGQHLQSQTHDAQLSWLKAKLKPPFLEHLSFRLGNQLFFIRVEDINENVHGPGNPNGFRTIAKGCNGVPCRMPMRQTEAGWIPELPGWGLIHADTSEPVYPFSLVSDEKTQMTDWEVHDFAVQLTRDNIVEKKLRRELMSSNGDPNVDPSIWFVGENGPEWAVVRAVRFPVIEATPPENLAEIAATCARLSTIGYFASIVLANSDDRDRPQGTPALPLWRGHAIYVPSFNMKRIEGNKLLDFIEEI